MRRPGLRSAVHLNRALSKLGILTRSQANQAILEGRVSVNGRVVRDPGAPIDPSRARIRLDGVNQAPTPWRTILLHKPRGVVTTRRDPEGRPTVFDVIGPAGQTLVAVGRLDLATSGLLLLTSDRVWAAWLTDPDHQVPRLYAVTVRGRVTPADADVLIHGVIDRGEQLRAASVTIRKTSGRESHLTVELRDGKNREVRRLFATIGHEVSRLKRVGFGPLRLGDLAPREWRDLSIDELAAAFPDGPLQTAARLRL